MSLSSAERQIRRYEALLKPRQAGPAPQTVPPGKQAAVFVLFAESGDDAAVLLIRRPMDTGSHRGEWAFPGGVREGGDGSFLETAYRETLEEIGVGRDRINYWGELNPVSTSGSGYVVWPFTGLLRPGTELKPSKAEVADIAVTPVDVFTSAERRRSITVDQNGERRTMDAYAHGGRVIWGATARILGQIFEDAAQVH